MGNDSRERALQTFTFVDRPLRWPRAQQCSNITGHCRSSDSADKIKSIDETGLTIKRPDGVTQKISVDEGTSFRENGKSITLADLKPGDHCLARRDHKRCVRARRAECRTAEIQNAKAE